MSDPGKAVFLSYASQDADAARKICDALRAAGVEVWFDQSELVGGDAWDQKIRRQIKDCALLIPVISAATQARTEGYFRLEWRLADQRTHLMAKGRPFLLPVVIDATRDADAHVPDSFTEVQWTRLPGGETPPAFCARVNRLLGGSGTVAGVARPELVEGADPGPNPASPKPATVRSTRRWLVPAIIGVIALGALAVWQPWKRADSDPPAGHSALPTSSTAPLTEAQKFVAQARKIYEDGDELSRDNLFLAEEMVQRALALDAAEPTAWELGAWLSCMMVWHSIDDSQARREMIQRQANRAVALAPDAVSAQLVFAMAQMAGVMWTPDHGPIHFAEIERSLLPLAEREPQNWKIQRALGTAYRYMNRTDDALRCLRRALELSGEHPMASGDLVNLLIRRQRYPEAEEILARALARQRSGRLLTFDLVVKCRWRGDTVGAMQAVENWPGWLLQADRGIAVAWQAALWARQPALALRIVQQFPREYVHDLNFSGPRAVLSARAQELAGNEAAAQADWHVVLQQCERDLATNAQDVVALSWKAWALARLGDQPGAQVVATLLRQRVQSVPNNYFQTYPAATLWATVGWTDLALSELRAVLEKPLDVYSLTRAYLELEPAFDPIRGNPRFQELLAAAPAPPVKDAHASVNEKSVAVLAFANLSDDKGNEYFSDGISEELLNVLAKIPGLKVTARTSAFFFKGKQVPLAEIAQQLGVAYVVEGSVRKQGDKVRITAQLIKAADGFPMWSDTFTRDLKDIFAVQDEIAALIAQNLKLSMGLMAASARRVVNPEAHRLVLEGRFFWNQRNDVAFERAEAAYQRALALDPEFAEAHAGLADVWAVRGWYRIMVGNAVQAEADFERAKEEVRQAQALNPALAEPYATLGVVLMNQWKFAESEGQFAQATALNPNYAVAWHWHAGLLTAEGRLDEAVREIERSLSLDPLSPNTLWAKAHYFRVAGRVPEALDAAERALALRPVHPTILSERALALWELGRRDEAVASARAVGHDLAAQPRWLADANAIYVLRLAGLQSEAEEYAGRVLANVPTDDYRHATTLVALGRGKETLFNLRTLPASAAVSVYFNPMWDALRDEAPFQQWLGQIGCAAEYKVARETQARLFQEQEAKK